MSPAAAVPELLFRWRKDDLENESDLWLAVLSLFLSSPGKVHVSVESCGDAVRLFGFRL